MLTRKTAVALDSLTNQDSRLPSALPIDSLFLPDDIELSDDKKNLTWTRKGAVVQVGPNLLARFLRISEARDKAAVVLAFARAFGPFHLCRHDIPATHSTRNLWPDRPNAEDSLCPVRTDENRRFSEPISVWAELAEEAAAMVRIAAAHAVGTLAEDRDSKRLRRAKLKPRIRRFVLNRESPLSIQKKRLSEQIEAWFAAANAHPIIVNGPHRPVLQISGGLMSALAMAILGSATGAELQVTCSACSRLYSPKRKPAPNRRRFCDDCRNKARWRLAQQDRRGGLSKKR